MIAALVTEGTSDQVLLPILRWVWEQATPEALVLSWVDTIRVSHPPRARREDRGRPEDAPL